MDTSASVVSVKIKNFLSIQDVEIKPGQVTQIVGRNNQGKTTVLKALEFAIKGSTDGTLVRNGEESAEVIVELSDQTTIKRRINPDGRQSVDVRRDGFKAPSPQSFIEALFDYSAFNPLDLIEPKRRNEAILQSIDIAITPEILAAELGIEPKALPPVDFNQHGLKVLEQCHKFFYQRRAEANRDAAEKKNRFDAYKNDLPKIASPTPNREQVTAKINSVREQISSAEKKLLEAVNSRVVAQKAKERTDKYRAAVQEIDHEIEKAMAHVRTLQARREEGVKFVTKSEQEDVPPQIPEEPINQLINDLKIELERLKSEIILCDKSDAIKKQVEMVDKMEQEANVAEAFSQSLTEKVAALAGPIKTRMMSKSEMPVPGLEYKEGQFYVDSVPVDNLSSSKALKLAIGVARKIAKRTKLICIDGAELLDDQAYASLREEIEGDGYTYFLTKVGEPFNAPSDQIVKMENGAMVQ